MGRVKHKTCEKCGADFEKSPAITYKVFSGRRFCGRGCAARASGDARTLIRPQGWRRDRSKEAPWAEWSLKPKSRLAYLCAKSRTRAKSNGLSHTLRTADLVDLWERQRGRCALSGRQFDLTPWGDTCHTNPDAPSLDRINSALGYDLGNVRLVTAHVNIALGRYGDAELRKLCADILGFGRDDEW